MDGYGRFVWPNHANPQLSTIYEGFYRRNRKEGKGKIVWAEGRIYEGDWLEGKQQGLGVMKWPDGMIYEGNWEEGLIKRF